MSFCRDLTQKKYIHHFTARTNDRKSFRAHVHVVIAQCGNYVQLPAVPGATLRDMQQCHSLHPYIFFLQIT